MKRLVIIGGGIAGLSAAWEASRSRADWDVTLIERDERLGGKIRTDSIEGFVLEQGPDSFLTQKPEALRLCEALGIAERLVPRSPRGGHSFIMHGHTLAPLPDGFSGLVPMDTAALAVSPLLSEAGRRRAMQAHTAPGADSESPEADSLPVAAGGDDESVASFVVRRFGEEVFQLIVEPLVGGIHAGDASQLSRAAILGSPQRAGEPRRTPGPRREEAVPPARPPFVAFPGGMAELVRRMEERLDGVTVLRGTAADAVRRRGGGYIVDVSDGGRREADALILAAPAHETARLVASLDPGMQDRLRLIPFASTVVIHLAYRRSDVAHPLDGYGYLIPSVERSDLVACSWISQKWEGRAPADRVLLRLFAGRFGRRDLLGTPDEELFGIARGELSATLGITAEPVLQKIHRWDMGMPQYTVGHLRRVEDIMARAAAFPGLFLAGSSYGGVGIPQCVESGARASSDALHYLVRQGALK